MLTLRPARADELSALSALCLRSKAVLGYDAAFMAACRAELTLHPDELNTTQIQVAESADGSIAGMAQVKVIERDAELLKLFVEPDRIRTGAGRLLFDWATNIARHLGAARIVIDADPDAAGFYQRMGALIERMVPSGSILGRMLPRFVVRLDE